MLRDRDSDCVVCSVVLCVCRFMYEMLGTDSEEDDEERDGGSKARRVKIEELDAKGNPVPNDEDEEEDGDEMDEESEEESEEEAPELVPASAAKRKAIEAPKEPQSAKKSKVSKAHV